MLIARGSGRRPLHQPGRGVVAQLVMRDFAWKTGELHGASELFLTEATAMSRDPGPLPFLEAVLTIAKFEPGM